MVALDQLSTLLTVGEPRHVEILACNNGDAPLNQDPIVVKWQLLR